MRHMNQAIPFDRGLTLQKNYGRLMKLTVPTPVSFEVGKAAKFLCRLCHLQ